MRVGVCGPQRQGAIKARQCLVEPLQSMQGAAAIAVRLGEAGRQRQRTVASIDRLAVAAQFPQRVAAIGVRLGIIGLQRDRPVAGHKRFVVALERVQSRAPIAQRVGVCGPQRQRSIVACQRLVKPPQRQQRVAAVVERCGIIGVSFQCAIYLLDGCSRIAALEKNDAEVVQAVELIGLNVQDLFVDFFGLRQSAGLMQRQCVRQQQGHTRQFRPLRRTESFRLIAKSKFRLFLHACLIASKIETGTPKRLCESLLSKLYHFRVTPCERRPRRVSMADATDGTNACALKAPAAMWRPTI